MTEAPPTLSPPRLPPIPRLPALALVILIISGCVFLCVGAALLVALLRLPDPLPVTVVDDGAAYPVETHASTVGDLLAELNLTVNEGDAVSPPPDTYLTPNIIVRVERARLVALVVDGEPASLLTRFSNPFDILKSAGVAVGQYDRVVVDGTPATLADLLVWPVPATQITVQHAVTVQINDDGRQRTIQTTGATVGQALFEAGITLYLADTVSPDINSPITGDTSITIRRSRPVTIIADGVSLETRSQGARVLDALADAGVTLQGLDYSIPPETSLIRPGMLVRVIRVSEKVEVEQEVIPYETIYQADANLELDQRRVLQEGQNGIRQTNVRVRYENGIEVSRTAETTAVAAEPVSRVIGYGTWVVIRTVETPDGPREYWRKLRMYATSYHPAALGGDDVTATGRKLTTGVVGSDPDVIPYDTQLFVPGYGLGIMADTGMSTPRLWIDLGYDDASYVPWSRWVDVYLLTPVPARINYLLPYME